MNRNEFKFWVFLLLLNSFLFLPGYLINSDTSHFFPFGGFLHGSIYERCKTIFVRPNLDVFRISVDLFMLVFACYFLRSRIRIRLFGWITGLYYVVILLFLTYFNAFEKLYRIPPILYNDLSLLKLGFFNIGDQSVLKSTVLMLLAGAVLFGLSWAVKQLIGYTRDLQLGSFSKSVLILLGIFMIISTLKSGFTPEPVQNFQETFALMATNLKSSADARKSLKNFNVDRINKKLDYKSIALKAKPDIYLLFVESYGKLLFVNEQHRDPFIACLDSCSARLERKGWNMVSDFSISPVSGGESWISYTSVMFGYNIRNQGTFNSMLKDPSMARYDNLFRVLGENGYKTYRLNAMPQNSNMEVPWDTYSSFYGIDQWINFNDLKYTGRLYGFGPSPPDQYSINFAAGFMKQNSPGPHALFFITQTTHHPFMSPNVVENDWRSLNSDHDSDVFHASVFLKKPVWENYLKAICYDISALSQFIALNPDTTAVFILIGDHQPPFLAGKLDGFETPVHIICRNHKFTDAFLKYGFQAGLKPDVKTSPIRHEGIYSMLLREFVEIFGTEKAILPEYRPYGLTTGTL